MPIDSNQYLQQQLEEDCLLPNRYPLRFTFKERYVIEQLAKKNGQSIRQILMMPYRLAELEIDNRKYWKAVHNFAETIKKR